MKKLTFLIIFLTILFFLIPLKINASYDAIISGNTVRIRLLPGTENTALYTVNSGTSITLPDKTLYSGTGCSAKWYKVNYKDKTGYVCSTYVKFVDNTFTGINVVDWTSRVNANNVACRSGANKSYSVQDTLSLGVNVRIISTVDSSNSGCSTDKWHKIQYYGNKTGYICSQYVTTKSDIIANDEEYSKSLKALGFTDSYIPYLTYLHNKYPNWVFIAKKTDSNFSVAVSSEEGKNYMQTTNNNYRTSSTPAEGSSWFKANTGVIAFYMDPRNFLSEERIFMFEKLDYSNEFEEKYPSMIKAIFGNGKLSDDMYTVPIFNAGKINKISPVHIASRIKQEVTANGSDSTNGTEFTFKGKKYSDYYNFFNIGAYEETIDGVKYSAITRGLAYAAKLVRNTGSLWNNIETAIVEGSNFLANGYVNNGQGTLYYQKFNVSPDAYYSRYTHQYMTNVQAPATEGNSTYNSYKKAGILSEPLIFEIPVYNNMPLYTSLPASGDNNTNLKSLNIEGYSLTPNFDSDILTYESYVSSITNELNVTATTESSKASISGTGKISLNEEDNDITITVTAQTGETKNYVITIKKVTDNTVSEKPIINNQNENNTDTNPTNNNTNNTTATNISTILNNAALTINGSNITNIKYNTSASIIQNNIIRSGAQSINITDSKGTNISGSTYISTGSKLTINTTNETNTYTFIIKGDTSGDGQISILDLLQVQKHIKGDKKLSNEYLLSADTSGDGKVTILDLLQVQKHIKGDKKL